MLGRLLEGLKRRLIGPPDKVPQRALLLVIFASLAVAGAGAYLAVTRGLETGTSSLPVLRPVLIVATSTITWILGMLWLLRRFLVFRDRRYAEQAAEIVGYAARSVRRLAYEAKDADGSTRVVAMSGDTPTEIEERILEALETGEDDRVQLNQDSLEDGEGDEEASEEVAALAERYAELELRAESLQDEIDSRLDDVLASDLDLTRLADVDGDRVAPVDLMDEETSAEVEEVEALIDELESVNEEMIAIVEEVEDLEGDEPDDVQDDVEEVESVEESRSLWSRVASAGRRAGRVAYAGVVALAKTVAFAGLGALLWHIIVTVGPMLELGLISQEVLEQSRETTWYVVAAIVGLVSLYAGRRLSGRSASGTADGSASGPDAVEESHRDTWREELKLVKLDLAATLSFRDLGWNLALPAALASAALLLLVQFWVSPWFYPVIFSVGLLVGVLNYLRVGWKRSRRLKALRADHDAIRFNDLAILVKEVEVPETRLYYAWLGDEEPRRYVHDDKHEFASDVADRAYEVLEGVPVSPSVMEKQAGQIERMHPDLEGFRDAELERIQNRILAVVQDENLVPKAKVIEEVVEWDMSNRRFGPGRKGQGHDPALVREAYRSLFPAAIVEQEVDVSRDDEEPRMVTAVRLRSDPLPPEYGEIRSRFASTFANYARWDPLYELPDVEDLLAEEPMYADSLGTRGEVS